MFSGKKPSISHLKVFGSPVFVHSTKPSRSKLDPRSEKCVPLSFDTEAKAYRCYRPSTKRVFISRDVTVDETSSNAPILISELREDDPPIITAASPRKEEQTLFLDQTSLPTPDASAQTPKPVYAPLDTPTGSDAIDQPEPLPDIPTLCLLAPAPDPPRRSDCVRGYPKHLQDFAAHVQLQTSTPSDCLPVDSTDFLTFQQAQTNPHWQTTMEEEIESIHKNHTWSVVSLPPNTKAISSKWVYRLKPGTRDNPARYKARFVAKGFE